MTTPPYATARPAVPTGTTGQYHQQGYNPYGQGSHGPGYGYGYAPPGQLAGWPIRVGASILDSLIVSIPAIVGVCAALVIDGDQEQLGAGGGIAIAPASSSLRGSGSGTGSSSRAAPASPSGRS